MGLVRPAEAEEAPAGVHGQIGGAHPRAPPGGRVGGFGLWDEVAAAHAWWQSQGVPGLGRFGPTVTVEGERRVRLNSPDHVVG
ncbi:hypothetical protein ACIQI7_10775 [Kitasatospora sp. NPDC092039]|uniref:hypothetical protein n=1 Tax=Kitasatospora sp. NPDC092039 TaxID=3364086 RepID=UPI0038143DEF